MGKVALQYVGKTEYIQDVPARDIEVEEEEAERLIKTGLYRRKKDKVDMKK